MNFSAEERKKFAVKGFFDLCLRFWRARNTSKARPKTLNPEKRGKHARTLSLSSSQQQGQVRKLDIVFSVYYCKIWSSITASTDNVPYLRTSVSLHLNILQVFMEAN